MPRPTRQTLFSAVLHRPAFARAPEWIGRVLYAGITSPDRLVRRRQVFTNIVAYVTAINVVVHVVTNAVYGVEGQFVLNIYNAAMLAFCILNHRLHALGDLVAATTLVLGIAFGHTFVVFSFGTASDLQFYFTLAGFTLFLVGVEHMRVFFALYALGFAALMVSYQLAPEVGFVLAGNDAARRYLSMEAAVNAIVMNGLLIGFALVSLHRAEARTEALLGAMLPRRIVERLRRSPDRHIADHVDGCTVLFADLSGFTTVANRLEPGAVVAWLDEVFTTFDTATERRGVDKIKTIGDCYMAAGGLESDTASGARAIGLFALDLVDLIGKAPPLGGQPMQVRIGIHTGRVTAGVIGNTRVAYDIWGDTVNTASRLESHGAPGRIHVSDPFRKAARGDFHFTPRGAVTMKSLGTRQTFFLTGPRSPDAPAPPRPP